jgi:hypothetical protein
MQPLKKLLFNTGVDMILKLHDTQCTDTRTEKLKQRNSHRNRSCRLPFLFSFAGHKDRIRGRGQ